MARQEGGNGGTALVAFALGMIAGAAVALLYAPAVGADTRRYLGTRARDGADRAAEAARHGREFLGRQRENLSNAVERGREAYREARGPKEST
jgi:gas vesicle protein